MREVNYKRVITVITENRSVFVDVTLILQYPNNSTTKYIESHLQLQAQQSMLPGAGETIFSGLRQRSFSMHYTTIPRRFHGPTPANLMQTQLCSQDRLDQTKKQFYPFEIGRVQRSFNTGSWQIDTVCQVFSLGSCGTLTSVLNLKIFPNLPSPQSWHRRRAYSRIPNICGMKHSDIYKLLLAWFTTGSPSWISWFLWSFRSFASILIDR